MHSTTMIRSALVNEHEWPSLVTGPSVASRPAIPVCEGDNDWEMLPPDDNAATAGHPQERSEQQAVLVDVANPRRLKHCSSSPDLRHLHDCGLLSGDYSVAEEDEAQDDVSSFGIISGPASVVSVSSTWSFRDAILSSPGRALTADSLAPNLSAAQREARATRQPRSRPRIVVKPIQRCIRSTGDLQSLVILEDEDVLGETDAMDYYHRKALGWKGRQSGLKMRPDEAKRLQISMYKKDLQRQSHGRR